MRSFLSATPMLSLPSLARALVLPALVPLLLSGCGAPAAAKGPMSPPPPPSEEAMPSFLSVGTFLPPDGGMDAAAAPAPLPTATSVPKAAEPSTPRDPAPPAKPPHPVADESGTESGTPGVVPEKKRGTLKAAVVDSQGGLSEADVRTAISSKHASFRRCYDLGKAASADFAGSVVLRVSISPAGNVASVDVLSSTTRNTSVDACVRDEVRILQFKATGAGAVVAFPLEFAP